MRKKPVKNRDELLDLLKANDKTIVNGQYRNHLEFVSSNIHSENGIVINNLIFDYQGYVGGKDVIFDDQLHGNLRAHLNRQNIKTNIMRVHFDHCIFKSSFSFENFPRFTFSDCQFEAKILLSRGTNSGNILFKDSCKFRGELDIDPNKLIVQFQDCTFKNKVNISNKSIENKIEFHNSNFEGDTNFSNANFQGIVSFQGSAFYKKVFFHNTNFNNTTVFSGVTFKENVLFTDTMFAGKTIFSKTVFEKGLDLSQAIIAGYLKLFDIDFKNENFETEYYEKFDKNGYRDAIEIEGVIPIENKVHTFQILKKAYQDQGNFDDATKMRKAEKNAQRLLNQNLKKKKDKWYMRVWLVKFFTSFSKGLISLKSRDFTTVDGLILLLNKCSNNHQTDFWRGIIFVIIVAFIFLHLTLFFAPHSDFEWQKLILFLNPTHNIKEIIEEVDTSCFLPYLFDFFGRIIVGFGIYQTVQAFRKFR